MGNIDQVEDAGEQLADIGVLDKFKVAPMTYMNPTAAIKAFCGVREQCLESLLGAGQCETTNVAG